MNFLKKHNVLSENQFGFQDNHSAEDALVKLTRTINDSLDSGEKVLCVFVDLVNAFDTVDHGKLIEILENSGIRGTALKLLKSYLCDRTQSVKIGETTSAETEVEYGVPQGTVLGPILFILYINNVFNIASSGELVCFADDSAIIYRGKSWKTLCENT